MLRSLRQALCNLYKFSLLLADSDGKTAAPSLPLSSHPRILHAASGTQGLKVCLCVQSLSHHQLDGVCSTSIKVSAFPAGNLHHQDQRRKTNVGLSPSSEVPAYPHFPSFTSVFPSQMTALRSPTSSKGQRWQLHGDCLCN